MFKYSNLLLLSHNVPFKARNRVFFSNNKVDIQVLEQKAYLAKVIMREIATDRTFEEIKQCSLTEKIKNVIEESKNKNVRDTVRKEMAQFFTTGVIANTQIFNQGRHQRQIYGVQAKKETISLNKDKTIKLVQKKIRFFPTTLISKQVFHELLHQADPFYLMTGHYGISKSIAVHLFWHLSNIVNQYECRQDKSSPRFPTVLLRVPKILYWNIKEEENKEDVREKILSQCSQIGEDLVDSQFLKPSSKSLRKFYNRKGIPLVLFADQFSLYVKHYRDNQKNKPKKIQLIQKKDNDAIQLTESQRKELVKYEESKQQSIQFEKNIKKCFGMLQFKNFDRTFYLSSVDIEKQLLKDLRLTDDPRHIEVKHHRFRYEEFLQNKSCLYELIDYFLFEVKEKIKTPLLHSKDDKDEAFLKNIRDNLFEKFKSPVYKIHLTPYSISACIREKVEQASSSISGITEINLDEKNQEVFLQKVLDKLGLLFEKCLLSGRQLFEKRIEYFIGKAHKTEKLAVLSALFLENLKMDKDQISQGSNDKKKQGGQNDYAQMSTHKFQINVNKFLNPIRKKEMVSVKNPDQNKSEDDYGYTPKEFQSFFSKALFFYNGDGKLCSYFSYSDIEGLLKGVREDVIWFLESYCEKMIEQFGMNERSKGKKFQMFFIETVSCGGFNLQFPLINARFKQIPNKKLWFASIPQEKSKIKSLNFFDGLKKSLQYMDDKNLETAVLVPILEKDIKQKEEDFFKDQEEIKLSHIDIKSPSIDVIIPQVPTKSQRRQDDVIRLYAFDLTTWNEPGQIKNKISKFLNNFLLFNDNNQKSINLNGKNYQIRMYYYVISPVKTLKSQDNKNPITNYLQEIKNQFGSQLEFGQSEYDNKNVLMVNQLIKNGKKIETSLTEVGNLPMDQASMKIGKAIKSAEIKHLWMFDKLMKEINSNTQQQKINQQKIDRKAKEMKSDQNLTN